MRPSALRWGLLFIAAGVIFILINLRYLDWDYWLDLLRWWPLLLIAIGIEMIFTRTRLKALAYLSPVLLIGAMFLVALDSGSHRIYRRDFGSTYSWHEKIDKAVEKIKATIDHGRSDMRIRRSTFNLASLRVDRYSRKPDIDYRVKDGVAFLDVDNRGRQGTLIVVGGRTLRDDWRMAFSDEVPLELKCLGDGSDLNLNLETIPMEKLTVVNDDGGIDLKIGLQVAAVEIDVVGDDADLYLNAPEIAGIQVAGDKYAGYLEKLGYNGNADGFVSDNYDEAPVKIRLRLDDNLGSLSIASY